MAHELPDLPYDFNALAPHIDEQTMRIHHGKHHAAYVAKLNGALEAHPDLQGKSVEELIGEIEDEYDPPPAVETGGIAAGLSIEEFAEATGVELEDGPYETAAGFVLHRLGRIAAVGDRVEVDDEHTLLVTEVDGHRITRLDLRATPTAAPPEPA